MKPGPRPRSAATHRLFGNPSKLNLDRMEATAPRPPNVSLTSPAGLTARALEVWREAVELLSAMKLVTAADAGLVARYATLVDLYETACREVERDGLTTTNPQSGRKAVNPAAALVRGFHADILRIEAEIGFTPASRASLQVDNGETGDSVRAWLDENSLAVFAASREDPEAREAWKAIQALESAETTRAG